MNAPLINLLKKRRTIYALGKEINKSNDEIEQLIQTAIMEAPSAFNSQSSRAVLLFNDEHHAFWEMTKDKLREIVPVENFSDTEGKLNSFSAAYGTILYFEDQSVVKNLQEQFPLYADNFPKWSEQSTAIAQFTVWVTLSETEIGASLQHYNPLIDDEVAKRWNIPENWRLTAQMPFGSIEADASEKTYINNEARFKTFK